MNFYFQKNQQMPNGVQLYKAYLENKGKYRGIVSEDGDWVNSDLLVEVSVDGAIVPMAEFEDWVSEIKAS